MMKRKLVIPQHVFREIVRSVTGTARGLETGVTLFGTPLGPAPDYVVLAVAGPGRKATHEPAHYSGDENHASAIYRALGSAMPGIGWLGELHVHPRGMTWLSRGDHCTVRQVLTGTEGTVPPEEFIAGVMQRRDGTVDLYPIHFTREWLQGREMEVEIVGADAPFVQQARQKTIEGGNQDDCRSSVRPQSKGSGASLPKARGLHWLRQWRERLGAYGRKIRRREVHAD
jgi:hypothetical protein